MYAHMRASSVSLPLSLTINGLLSQYRHILPSLVPFHSWTPNPGIYLLIYSVTSVLSPRHVGRGFGGSNRRLADPK